MSAKTHTKLIIQNHYFRKFTGQGIGVRNKASQFANCKLFVKNYDLKLPIS